jgi:putative MATE family efflux protein
VAVAFTAFLLLFSNIIFTLIGTADVTTMTLSYSRIIFAGSIFIFFINNALAILRAEGDANRAMYAMVFGAVLNIFLDPFFIYTFGWGVAGAALATIISMGISGLILVYWLFLRRNTFVSFKFKAFKFKKDILRDVLKVGLPASFQQLSMSVTMIAIIVIINIAEGGKEGVAIYNTGWRVVMIAILPLLGMATAVTSVTGAAYGARDLGKLKTAYLYSAKIGLFIEVALGVAIFLLAPLISIIFTTRPEDIIIRNGLTVFLHISCIFYPGAAFGIASSAMFQGIGKGTYSLIATLLRTIVFTIIISLLFVIVLGYRTVGIWWAIVVANLMGSVISFAWGNLHIKKLYKLSGVN